MRIQIIPFFILINIFIFSVVATDSLSIQPVLENNNTEPVSLNPIETPVAETAPSTPPIIANPPNTKPTLLHTMLTLILDKVHALQGDVVNINARLSYENDSPIVNEPIQFYANSQQIGVEKTTDSGLAELFWNTSPFSPGNYRVRATYAGNTRQSTVATSSELTIDSPTITAAVVAPAVRHIESCTNSIVSEEQTVRDTCTINVTKKICTDEPVNQTCTDDIKSVSYLCNPHDTIISRTEEHCRTSAIVVNNAIRINVEDYVCTTQEDAQITVLCDSRFDGNGDGTCTSGESCLRFTIRGNNIVKEEKNSHDDFVAHDDKYFVPQATIEVMP